ncbi:hypothetical protein NPIL_608881 [Nephila pilipes]|uniref:Uncharacterized protein n=1 Tax=Nephila pilipes TaxID=299642 RepID=A0A8X6MLI5_NEPPI|nr:hypothetical protein NPIL_608881 [Nephila pilipes]
MRIPFASSATTAFTTAVGSLIRERLVSRFAMSSMKGGWHACTNQSFHCACCSLIFAIGPVIRSPPRLGNYCQALFLLFFCFGSRLVFLLAFDTSTRRSLEKGKIVEREYFLEDVGWN